MAATFTPQQTDILTSKQRHLVLDATTKTGKTTVLRTLLLNLQNKPTLGNRFIYVTGNSLATRQLIENLQKITALPWDKAMIGTLAEIGYKLVTQLPQQMGYSKPPRVVSQEMITHELQAAREAALRVYPQVTHPSYLDQVDKELIVLLRDKNVATPHTLQLELLNGLRHQNTDLLEFFQGYHSLFVDDGQDLTTEEWIVVSQLQELAERTCVAGNTNVALYSKHHHLDPENWFTLIDQDAYHAYRMHQAFNVSTALGTFVMQLSSKNGRHIVTPEDACKFQGGCQKLQLVQVYSYPHLLDMIHQLVDQLALPIRNRLLLVVSRHPEETYGLCEKLRFPAFIQKDRNNLWCPLPTPTTGAYCTTPLEALYLRPDYVVIPNCTDLYWPRRKEKRLDGARRAFVRAIGSAKNHVYFMVPGEHGIFNPSLFISEGNYPKETVEKHTLINS